MISDYLAQTMTVRRRTGLGWDGEPEYEEIPGVPCRWEARRRMVRNDQGEQVVSESTVLTQEFIYPGDELVDESGRSWSVLSISETPDLDGRTVVREVSV